MSEYWVSKKRYFCKYCDIYIADDAPSRQQHENGLRHKGNKDRFIRQLYKSSEQKRRDKEDEDKEMRSIDQAAKEAYAKDVGHAAAEASVPRPVPSTSKPVHSKPSDPYSNYSTAESLGFVDEEAERLAAEARLRQNEGRIGEWSTVTLISQEPIGAPSTAGFKRARTPPLPDDVPEEEDTRRYKMRQRSAAVGLGEIWEPGEIKVKKREDGTVVKREDEGDPSRRATNVPEWQPMQLKKGVKREEGSTVKEESPKPASGDSSTDQAVKVEETPEKPVEPTPVTITKEEESLDVKPSLGDPPAANGGSMFRKRKIASKPNKAIKRQG